MKNKLLILIPWFITLITIILCLIICNEKTISHKEEIVIIEEVHAQQLETISEKIETLIKKYNEILELLR